MAVCAEQNALAGLRPHFSDTKGATAMTQMEALCRRIAMMELKRRGVLIEATKTASTASLFDENSLDPPPPLGHRRRAAFDTPKATVRALQESRVAMLRAAHICPLEARLAGLPSRLPRDGPISL